MRRFYTLAIFILLLIAAQFTNSCKNHSNQSLEAKIKRGDYLVNTVCNCMHCHAGRDFTKFSGPVVPGTEGKGGKPEGLGTFARNITPAVLGKWTDEEIVRAITTGITKTGDTLFPTMPYTDYMHLSKDDAASIAAYLRTLKPIPDSVPKRDPAGIPTGLLAFLYKNLYVNNVGKTNSGSTLNDDIARGAYLVKIGHCNGCHTPFSLASGMFKTDSLLSGGIHFNRPQYGYKVNSANLTPDSATGIGTWTERTFLAKFTNYRNESAYNYNPGKHNTDMPWAILAGMKDADIESIYRYLLTIKPVSNKVEKWPQ
jgi:mono/diheme cytochrome c family protein